MGSAILEPTGAFEAGSYGSFTLTYTAGPFGIDDSGGIKISFRTTTDMGKPQFTDPAGDNYTTAEASNGAGLHLLLHQGRQHPAPDDGGHDHHRGASIEFILQQQPGR